MYHLYPRFQFYLILFPLLSSNLVLTVFTSTSVWSWMKNRKWKVHIITLSLSFPPLTSQLKVNYCLTKLSSNWHLAWHLKTICVCVCVCVCVWICHTEHLVPETWHLSRVKYNYLCIHTHTILLTRTAKHLWVRTRPIYVPSRLLAYTNTQYVMLMIIIV